MKIKRFLSVLLTLALVLGCFAGCGKEKKEGKGRKSKPKGKSKFSNKYSERIQSIKESEQTRLENIRIHEKAKEMIDEEEQKEKENWKDLHAFYALFAEKYSGIIKRSEEDFIRKAEDYSADGGKCAVYKVNNAIKGYAFYYQTEEKIVCVEAAAKEGYYHGTIFHRIIEDFMIQGGGYIVKDNTLMEAPELTPIKGEFRSNGVENNIVHELGLISMARTNEPNSATCQFFIVQIEFGALI